MVNGHGSEVFFSQPPKDYVCEGCGKVYKSRKGRDDHYAIVHCGEKKYACDDCGKLFGRPDALKVHMLTHSGELPFQVLKICA